LSKLSRSIDIVKGYSDQNGVILCSFGKDSMVLLHLVQLVCGNIPVVFWREPGQNVKYRFANQVIESWNLVVFDYPPVRNEVLYHDGLFNVCRFRSVGNTAVLLNSLDIIPCSDSAGCTLFLSNIPTVKEYSYPWKVTYHGQKSSDVDTMMGVAKLKDHQFQFGTTTMVYPLKDWDDTEIWNYIREFNVPYNREWYDLHIPEYNTNYHLACKECFDPTNPAMVYCPIRGSEIPNIGYKQESVYLNNYHRHKEMTKWLSP